MTCSRVKFIVLLYAVVKEAKIFHFSTTCTLTYQIAPTLFGFHINTSSGSMGCLRCVVSSTALRVAQNT